MRLIPELELVVWEAMELVSVLCRVNGDIGGGSLAPESLTDRVTFPAFISLHLYCTSFWRDMLFASSPVIPAALIAILLFKAPLVFPNNPDDFSIKGYSFLDLTMLASYCFMLIDENLQ